MINNDNICENNVVLSLVSQREKKEQLLQCAVWIRFYVFNLETALLCFVRFAVMIVEC